MSILNLTNTLKIPGEIYYLQTKKADPDTTDDWDNVNVKWVNVQEIEGIIQKRSENPETRRGQEEIAEYEGFFEPNFVIPPDELGDYRILHTVNFDDMPEKVFTRYFHIKEIDRNLVLDNQRTHVEMKLEIAKKYPESGGLD